MNIARLLIPIFTLYVLLMAVIALLQNQLLYLPQRLADPNSLPGLRPWPADGAFRGFLAEPAGPLRGTAVVFHGNAGHAGHRVYYAAALAPLGFRTILAEYPGYGPRDGNPGERLLVDDARATLQRVRQDYDGPILVIGESLGAAVAAGAALPDQIAGLLLITPWDRLDHVAAHHYPWLPVRWLLRDRYDSAARLAGFPRPVVVAIAERDSIIPNRFGRQLYQALSGPKQLVEIAAADHNGWLERVDPAWWRRVVDFLLGPADGGVAPPGG